MQEYQIIKPRYWKRDYEILTGEGMKIGELTRKGGFSSRVDFVSRTNQWVVKPKGWNHNRVILVDKRGIEVGFLKKKHWSGKIIFYYKNRKYRFKRYHWAANIYLWEDIEGRKIMSFKGKYHGKNKVGTMRIYQDMDVEFRDLMVHLGWYMLTVVQMQQASGGGSA